MVAVQAASVEISAPQKQSKKQFVKYSEIAHLLNNYEREMIERENRKRARNGKKQIVSLEVKLGWDDSVYNKFLYFQTAHEYYPNHFSIAIKLGNSFHAVKTFGYSTFWGFNPETNSVDRYKWLYIVTELGKQVHITPDTVRWLRLDGKPHPAFR